MIGLRPPGTFGDREERYRWRSCFVLSTKGALSRLSVLRLRQSTEQYEGHVTLYYVDISSRTRPWVPVVCSCSRATQRIYT